MELFRLEVHREYLRIVVQFFLRSTGRECLSKVAESLVPNVKGYVLRPTPSVSFQGAFAYYRVPQLLD